MTLTRVTDFGRESAQQWAPEPGLLVNGDRSHSLLNPAPKIETHFLIKTVWRSHNHIPSQQHLHQHARPNVHAHTAGIRNEGCG